MTKFMLSKQLGAVQFSLWELHLYLDTHPDDLSALALYNKYKEKCEKLTDEYIEQCGELYSNGNPGVSWLKDPWPWEIGGNG